MTALALECWKQWAGGRPYPHRHDVDPAEIPGLWPHLFLVDVASGLERAVFEYCGSVLTDAFAVDLTGRSAVSGLPAVLQDTLPYALGAVVTTGKPLINHRTAAGPEDQGLSYRTLILPLGWSGGIDHLLGAFNFKRD